MASVMRRNSCSSCRSFASARLRSSISVFVPYHWTTLPRSSRTGSTRTMNQRYSPSWRRSRSSNSPGFPVGRISSRNLAVVGRTHRRHRLAVPAGAIRETGVLAPPSIDIIDGAVRALAPDLGGDRVEDRSQSIFRTLDFGERLLDGGPASLPPFPLDRKEGMGKLLVSKSVIDFRPSRYQRRAARNRLRKSDTVGRSALRGVKPSLVGVQPCCCWPRTVCSSWLMVGRLR